MGAETLGLIAGIVATFLAAVVSAFSERRTKESKTSQLDLTAPTEDLARDCRLYELRSSLQRQESIARLNSWSDSLLTFGQYIIGGLLASSFIQDSAPKQVVGILGVLVLLSSLIRQRYRPDIKAVGAKRRVALIRSFIREVEDNLYALNKGQENAPSVFSIRQRVTERLSRFDEIELIESQEDDGGDEAG
ncbi:hypothetical protein Lepto7375DRAFT_2307 [Leptolyngbya sp. PCC 7375]|nr:hypothetical protein Lepto7375DRAFT_2307 [Leptolyngbya sp. PCC 7375]